MTLDKTDVQKFMKRLRKSGQKNIKYYAVGEYGGDTMRPHYHIIILNLDLELFVGKQINNQIKLGNIPLDGRVYMWPNTWPQGYVTIGTCTIASVGYTLKYVTKDKVIPIHKRDDREKEFSLMSKGMGLSYVTDEMIKWHRNDLKGRMYIPLKDGKKISMPRYYKKHFYSESEREQINNYLENKEVMEYQKLSEKEIRKKEEIRIASGAQKIKRNESL